VEKDKKNMIKGIRLHGQWCEDLGVVKLYYEDMIKETIEFNVKFRKIDFNSILESDNRMLT